MVNMIALGIVTLFQHPDMLEELCRYHTASAMAMRRVAKEDTEIVGKVSLT